MLPDTVLGSIVPARDRCLPVAEAFASLLPDGGLRRGHVVGCSGPAAVSLAAGLVVESVVAGSWLAVVGVPMLGVDALSAMGVPLERVVAVDVGGLRDWAERLAATIEGFELVLTRPPPGAERHLRKIGQRLQVRGAVLVPVGPVAPGVPCDVELSTTAVEWAGVDRGAGHLVARKARVRSGGRRMPRPAEVELWLPGAHGRVALCDRVNARAATETDAAAEVVVFERAG